MQDIIRTDLILSQSSFSHTLNIPIDFSWIPTTSGGLLFSRVQAFEINTSIFRHKAPVDRHYLNIAIIHLM